MDLAELALAVDDDVVLGLRVLAADAVHAVVLGREDVGFAVRRLSGGDALPHLGDGRGVILDDLVVAGLGVAVVRTNSSLEIPMSRQVC